MLPGLPAYVMFMLIRHLDHINDDTLLVLHSLKQYSGETQFQEHSTDQQVLYCLRNFDLSAYRRVLSEIAVWIY